MLVKFISFVISLFGTKRYKPVLFTGLALVATLVGTNTVFSLYREQPRSAASTTSQDETPQSASSSESLSAQGLHQQTPAQDNQVAPTTPASPSTPASSPATTPVTNVSISAIPDSTITMKREANGAATSQAITASSSDSSKVQWSASTDTTPGLTTVFSGDKSNSSTVTFSFKSDSTLTPGQYTVTIHAKDSGRGLDLTKTITVIITAE